MLFEKCCTILMIFMRKIIVCVMALIFVVSSCNPKKSPEEPLEYLAGDEILSNEIGELDATVIDTLLFLHLNKMDVFYHVFTIPNLDSIGDFAPAGDGPMEFRAPRLLKRDSSGYYVSDGFKEKLLKIALTVENDTLKASLVKEWNMPVSLGLTQNIDFIKQDILIGNAGQQASQSFLFKVFNLRSGNEEYTNTELPYLKQAVDLKLTDYYTFYYNFLQVKPDGNRFVIAFNYIDKIMIFDSTNKMLFESNGTKINPEQIIKEGTPTNLHNYYFDVEVDNDYIYCLYYDQSDVSYGRNSRKLSFVYLIGMAIMLSLLR